jgi:hypothetical protein
MAKVLSIATAAVLSTFLRCPMKQAAREITY